MCIMFILRPPTLAAAAASASVSINMLASEATGQDPAAEQLPRYLHGAKSCGAESQASAGANLLEHVLDQETESTPGMGGMVFKFCIQILSSSPCSTRLEHCASSFEGGA
jgi:hypothetical protein